MKVSIITVSFNAEDTIRRTIESVLSQSYPEIEYIVIDGGSTDRTVQIINEYQQQIETIISEPDEGEYYAMNKGLDIATGEVIGFLCADDVFMNQYSLETLLSPFLSDREPVDVVWGDLIIVGRDNPEKIIRYYRANYFNRNHFKFGIMPPHPTVYIKKDCFLKYGKFDTQYSISADFDLVARFIYRQSLPYKYVKGIFVRMSDGGVTNSDMSNKYLLNQEILVSNKANGVPAHLVLLLMKIPIRIIELIRAYFLNNRKKLSYEGH